jgi:hypothetical protein
VTGFVSTKVQALPCYLATSGEMSDASANANLCKALSNLRQLVGDHLLIADQSVAFDPNSAYWVDSEAFSRQVEAALRQGDVPSSPETAAALAEAVALYQGDFLAGLYVRDAPAFEEKVLAERKRLRGLALQALHVLVGYHAARGEHAQARHLYQESLVLKRQIGNQRGVALTLACVGKLAQTVGDYAEARQHYCQALVLLSFIQHHPAAEKQVRDQVASVLSELKARLAPEVVAAAEEQGKTRTLEEVVEPFLAWRPATSLSKGA